MCEIKQKVVTRIFCGGGGGGGEGITRDEGVVEIRNGNSGHDSV